ncbi:hypothetical protein LTR85_011537 [Meristemomyces frigidus]|nr:hypothetical protein LTR85_011537 [Meristemomyces frigidus]
MSNNNGKERESAYGAIYGQGQHLTDMVSRQTTRATQPKKPNGQRTRLPYATSQDDAPVPPRTTRPPNTSIDHAADALLAEADPVDFADEYLAERMRIENALSMLRVQLDQAFRQEDGNAVRDLDERLRKAVEALMLLRPRRD